MKLKLFYCLLVLTLIPGAASARVSLSELQKQIVELKEMVQSLSTELATTRDKLDQTRAELDAVQNNTVLMLDERVMLSSDANGFPTVLFNGVNLQIVNGEDVTESSNGVGNLVMGYNESKSVFVDRMGSHNIVIGDNQAYPDNSQLLTEAVLSGGDLVIVSAKNISAVAGENYSMTVGDSLSTDIGANRTITVGSDSSRTIGRNQTVNVGGDQTSNLAGARTIFVGLGHSESIGASKTVTIGASQSITVGADKTENIGQSLNLSINDNALMTVARDLNMTIGKKHTLQAVDQIDLKTGKALASFKKDGSITLQGKDIIMKGSGKIDVDAGGPLTLKGSQISQN